MGGLFGSKRLLKRVLKPVRRGGWASDKRRPGDSRRATPRDSTGRAQGRKPGKAISGIGKARLGASGETKRKRNQQPRKRWWGTTKWLG